MTADYDEIVPGLDHSLCKADGLLFWKQTPGYSPPTRRTSGKRSKAKAATGRNDGSPNGQEVFWEDMAEW